MSTAVATIRGSIHDELLGTLELDADPPLARFRVWTLRRSIDAARRRSRLRGFQAAYDEGAARAAVLAGPNPPDQLLHALAAGVARAREELGLTAREAEVLLLVARNFTNREIAEALVISVRTAEHHVAHILRKLRAPNRRAAAAIAHRLVSSLTLLPGPRS